MTDVDREMLDALRQRFNGVLNGGEAQPLEVPSGLDGALLPLVETLNCFLHQFGESRRFAISLAAGNLDAPPPVRNQVAASFKELHASLLHLTWQTRQIAQGDYSQRVHFMGEFSASFNAMVEALAEKRRTEEALQEARSQVRQLEGIIPICMHCKKIRNDSNTWQQLERYISDHTDAEFSHGICPTCFEKHYKNK